MKSEMVEQGVYAQAMEARVSDLVEELEQMRLLEQEASRRQCEAQTQEQEAMRLLGEARMEEDAIRSRAQKACQDAQMQREMDASRHQAEMKDLQLQEMSLKAGATQLRTELQNAEREASMRGQMHTLGMQAEQSKCSVLQAELEEAKSSDI